MTKIKRINKDGYVLQELKSNAGDLYGKGAFGILDLCEDPKPDGKDPYFGITFVPPEELKDQSKEIEDIDTSLLAEMLNGIELTPNKNKNKIKKDPEELHRIVTEAKEALKSGKTITVDSYNEQRKNDDITLEKLSKEFIDIEQKFINESKLEFIDISSELYRIYEFNNGKTIMISEPLKLNVSKSGGHRLYDESGISHYIPQGWIRVSWKTKPGQPNFVK